MDKEYFETNEATDYKKLVEFNEKIGNKFNLTQLPEKSAIDASGTTSNGHKYDFELKQRNQTIIFDEDGNVKIKGISKKGKEYIADSIMIEAHKACSLAMDLFYEKKEPCYINFLKNGIIIHNLNKLTKRIEPQKMIIKSEGYQKFEVSLREFLHLDDAIIYMYDDNGNLKLVKK